jgi:hypothetical protein
MSLILLKQHEIEIKIIKDSSYLLNFHQQTLKAVDEAEKFNFKNLANDINKYLININTQDLDFNQTNSFQENINMEKNEIKDQKILGNSTTVMNQNPVEHSIDDFNLIENLEDLNTLLTNTSDSNSSIKSNPSEQKIIQEEDYQSFLSSLENNLVSLDNVEPSPFENSNADINQSRSETLAAGKGLIMILDQNVSTIERSSLNVQNLCSKQVQSSKINNFNSNNSTPQQQQSLIEEVNDEQDKKIKTLADNIIAAMPHKIKTNSYNSNIIQHTNSQELGEDILSGNSYAKFNKNSIKDPINLDQEGLILNKKDEKSLKDSNDSQILNHNDNNQTSFMSYKASLNYLKRNAASFDDNFYISTQLNRPSVTNCQVYNNLNLSHRNPGSCNSSTSISPTSSSLSFQIQQKQLNLNNTLLDDSQGDGDDSTCSSTFHIDSPPSTAEFCQYFHASSSSSYYKKAIETGFAQLTLTDDEQRELYEAALVIQNAYRRYILRKKKKIRLNSLSTENQEIHRVQKSNDIGFSFMPSVTNHLSRSSSASLSSINSNQSIHSTRIGSSQNQQQITTIKTYPLQIDEDTLADRVNHKIENLSDDENNSNSSEDQKQYQAACIIQKYYRRYKQVI